jgi:YbbR domain-containing protein
MNYFLGRNLVPKLLAVVVALVVWVFVMNEQNPPLEGSFQVALSSRNLAEDMIVLESPATVRVKVRGLRNAIAGAAGRDFKATVDLKGLAAGQYNLPVTVVTPGGYDLVEVVPDKVAIKMDAIRSKQVTIEARLSGPLVSELALGQVEIRPGAATVTGPQSLLDTVGKVVAPVEIRGRTSAFSQETRLVVLGTDGHEMKNIKLEPVKVIIAGNLEPSIVGRQVEIKTVLSGNLPEGILLRRVFTEPSKIEIKGSKELIDAITTISTEPIPLAGINKDVTKEVSLQLQQGVTAEKKTVMVRITVGQGP